MAIFRALSSVMIVSSLARRPASARHGERRRYYWRWHDQASTRVLDPCPRCRRRRGPIAGSEAGRWCAATTARLPQDITLAREASPRLSPGASWRRPRPHQGARARPGFAGRLERLEHEGYLGTTGLV